MIGNKKSDPRPVLPDKFEYPLKCKQRNNKTKMMGDCGQRVDRKWSKFDHEKNVTD